MTLSFDAMADHFDARRGLPREALRAWMACVHDLTGHRTVRVIEPGIGTGRISLPLAAMGHVVWGCDISLPMLDRCSQSARELGVADQVELVQADATDLPLDDGSGEIGVIAQLLYLVPDWPAVLDELARVISPGGWVIHVSEPSTENPALSAWSTTWRTLIEQTGYIHPAQTPTDDEIEAEFRRRWPDTRRVEISTWSFGQTVAQAMQDYDARLRPLYANVPELEWLETVDSFLHWGNITFDDQDDVLGGTITLSALMAAT